MPARARYELKVNMTGPDGSSRSKGDEIPAEWLEHEEFDVAHLVASGGAKKVSK